MTKRKNKELNKSIMLSFRITKEECQKLDELSTESGLSRSKIIRYYLAEVFENAL